MALIECRECAQKISDQAISCPHCGAPVNYDNHYEDADDDYDDHISSRHRSRISWGLIVFFVFVIGYCASSEEELTEEEAQAKAEQEAEDRRKGFHCLSAWDGSHPEVKRTVKNNLADPDSFDHMETRISPVDDAGWHRMVMDFRASNGYGALTIARVHANVEQSTCAAYDIEFDQ